MNDPKDFNRFAAHAINGEIGQRRQDQFPCSLPKTRPSAVRRNLQSANSLIHSADRRFREMRVALLRYVLMLSMSSAAGSVQRIFIRP
jgi:hypothetical protein